MLANVRSGPNLSQTVMNESVSRGQRWMNGNSFTHAHPRGDAHHFALPHESFDQHTGFLLRKRPHPLHCALNLQFSLDNIREGAAANCTHKSHQQGPYLRRAYPDRARKDPQAHRRCVPAACCVASRANRPESRRTRAPSKAVPGTKHSVYAPDSNACAPDTSVYAPNSSAYAPDTSTYAPDTSAYS